MTAALWAVFAFYAGFSVIMTLVAVWVELHRDRL